jgi:uncharacterized delta-60 repeat protein
MANFIIRSLLFVVCCAAFVSIAFASGVDTGFTPQLQTSFYNPKSVSILISMPDGKIIAAGSFNLYNGHPTGELVRLNGDATLDTTFNNDLILPGGAPSAIFIQPDGKLLVKGSFTLSDGTVINSGVIRLDQNGFPDPTFSFSVNGGLGGIDFDPQGRMYAGGFFQITENGSPVSRNLIRLNDDGSIDPTFTAPSIGTFGGFHFQNSKIIYSDSDSVSGQYRVSRLNSDGTPDASFTPVLVGNQGVYDTVTQSDGKLLILNGLKIYRSNVDGGLDPSFQQPMFPGISKKINLQPDGKLVQAYLSNGNNFGFQRVVRFMATGATDPSFTPYDYNGQELGGQTLQSNGGFLMGDSYLFPSTNNRFYRLLPTGLLDTSFNVNGTGFQWINPGRINGIGVLPNGKIMIGGIFDTVNGAPRNRIARLNSDSSVDSTFQINTAPTGNYFSQVNSAYHFVTQPDGKMIVSGNFVYVVNGQQKQNVVRLNTDGSIDPTFAPSLTINNEYSSSGLGDNRIFLRQNGGVLIGTTRTGQNSFLTPLVLSANGTLDSSFNPTIYAAKNSISIYDIDVEPDGKILIGGKWTSGTINETVFKGFLARLNSDGTTDQTFQIFEPSNVEISKVAILTNGQTLDAVRTNNLSTVERRNSDGSLDATFQTGTGANGRINTLLVLPDHRIMIGGRFTAYNGQPRRNLAILNEDGTLAESPGDINRDVLCMDIDGQGRVLIGGDFTTIYNGGQQFSVSYIARFTGASSSLHHAPFDFDGDGKTDIGITRPNGGVKEWWLSRSSDLNIFSTVFGVDSDIPAPGDFTGDGKTDIAVFRPANGNWFVLRSDDFTYLAFPFGSNGDIPMPADFDGDGKADPAVFRPSSSTWFISRSSDGQTTIAQFGAAGDQPVAADYDGDGKADIAIYRLNNGSEEWWIQRSSAGLFATVFGATGDKAVPGDYTGDGKTDIAVWRPSNGNWFILRSEDFSFLAFPWGANGDIPAPGDYDGDGKFDAAVFRQSTATWFVNRTGGSGPLITNFGAATDNPVAGVFVR